MAPVLRAFTISAWQAERSVKSQETRKILEISCDMEYTFSGPPLFVLETDVKIANFKNTRLYSRVHSGKVGVTMMDKSCWSTRSTPQVLGDLDSIPNVQKEVDVNKRL